MLQDACVKARYIAYRASPGAHDRTMTALAQSAATSQQRCCRHIILTTPRKPRPVRTVPCSLRPHYALEPAAFHDFRKCQLFCATAGSASPATPRESAESRSQGAERNRSSSFSHCECHSQPPWCARSGACGLEHADCPNHSPPARHPPTPPKKIVLQHAGNSSNASHTHKRQGRSSRRPRCANIHATQHPYLTPRVDGDENGPSV